jgi:carboxymethylenebutenolidase
MRLRLLFLLGALGLFACGQSDEPAATATATATATGAAPETTAEVHADDEPVATAITGIAPAVEVVDQEIAYGSTENSLLEGFFVLPADVTEPVPGIVMIHEWWGLNDNIRAMARRLAGEGYAVLAIDLYGGRTAATAAEAQQLMAGLQSARPAALDNLRQAHAYLEEYAFAPRIATLGWCLGGGWALEAGIEMADDIDAIVMFYGQVVSDRVRLGLIDAPLLGHFAELDASIPVADVVQFRRNLRELGKTADVLVYSGVDHAFANPSGNAYNHEAATEAWEATLEFLDARLR